jgi:hypothetical protein
MVKEIKLTKGKFAIVDDEDYDELMKYKWYAIKGSTIYFYARRTPFKDGQHKISMHRQILNFPDKIIDHVNRNGLDNRKSNLRLCSKSENRINCKKHKNNTSGFRGVSWHPLIKKWQVRIQHNNISVHIGYFSEKIQGAKSYDKKAIEFFGKFVVLNFPEEIYG